MNTLIPTNLTVGDRPVNVYEWETKDVVSWLRENDLFDYTAIFGEKKMIMICFKLDCVTKMMCFFFEFACRFKKKKCRKLMENSY